MAGSTLDLEFRYNRSPAGGPNDPGSPMRILLVGDFRGTPDPGALAERRPVTVDIDSFDAALNKLGAGFMQGETYIAITELEQLYPDSLAERAPTLKNLIALRKRLQRPTEFEAAAAELREHLVDLPEPDAAPAESTADPGESTTDTLSRLLGSNTPSEPQKVRQTRTVVDQILADAVSAHIAPDAPAEYETYMRALDEALSKTLSACLHDPAFAALEAAWRGLHRLITTVETDESLSISILNANPAELQQELGANPADSGLGRQLAADGEIHGGDAWSLIIVLHRFTPDPDDLNLLSRLGALAASLGTAVLADADPRLVGAANMAQLDDPGSWQGEDAESLQSWAELRKSAQAQHIGLVLPPLLLRLPYGAATDEIDSFRYEEWQSPGDWLPWGYAALGAAELVGRSFTQNAWNFSLGDQLTLEDLPAHAYRADGEYTRTPCAGVWLRESAIEALLQRGVMAMASHAQLNAARLARFQSIAAPLAPLRGPWKS